ncbi:MAG: CHAD domain-containing protein [Burkholderiaceae bacterium]
MIEQEIRFRVPQAMAEAVRAELVRISGDASVTPLRAVYFDTEKRELAAMGIGLRLRREGGDWVQTAKTASLDGLSRLEHNLPRDEVCLDLPAFAGRVGLERLGNATELAVLQDRLIAIFETDIKRQRTVVRTQGANGLGAVEIAFDTGLLLAGGRRASVCELEFELIGGELEAIWAVAEPWIARFGLTALPAGKAQRGQRLRRGVGPPCETAGRAQAHPGEHASAAYARLFDDCQRQIAGNASALVTGEGDDTHVHQLRVGIRRLRALVKVFESWIEPPPKRALSAVVRVFRLLGRGRDRDVYRHTLMPAIIAAGGEPPAAEILFGDSVSDVAEVCSDPAFQWALMTLQRHRHGLSAARDDVRDAAGLADLSKARLRSWTRRVGRQAARFRKLDVTQRHDLRKRIKRLRYAFEFLAPLLPRRWRALLKPLSKAQTALGEWCDLQMAGDRLREVGADGFALGWSVARITMVEAGLATRMARLARQIGKALR